jgi:hypothetical protein
LFAPEPQLTSRVTVRAAVLPESILSSSFGSSIGGMLASEGI